MDHIFEKVLSLMYYGIFGITADIGRFFHSGIIVFENPSDRPAHGGKFLNLIGLRWIYISGYPVYPVFIFMEPVKVQFVNYICKNKNTTGQSNPEAGNIDKAVSLVLFKVSQCNLQKIGQKMRKHRSVFLYEVNF